MDDAVKMNAIEDKGQISVLVIQLLLCGGVNLILSVSNPSYKATKRSMKKNFTIHTTDRFTIV